VVGTLYGTTASLRTLGGWPTTRGAQGSCTPCMGGAEDEDNAWLVRYTETKDTTGDL
jgi:hypothetical protein